MMGPLGRFLGRLIPPDDREDVLGTLEELARHRLHIWGPRRTRAWHLTQLATIGLRLRADTLRTGATGRGAPPGFAALRDELRIAVRSLRRRPGFTLAAVATLALGLGGTTLVYSIVHATLFRAPPYPAPERLVWAWGGGDHVLTGRQLVELQTAVRPVVALSGFTGRGYSLLGGETPEEVSGLAVSVNHFDVIGQATILGRGFLPEDRLAGAEPVVVLGYELWQSRFGGSPSVLGQRVQLYTSAAIPMVQGAFSGLPHTVVGVAPPTYRPFGWTPGLLTPLSEDRLDPSFTNLGELRVIGRLAAGISLEQAAEAVLGALPHLDAFSEEVRSELEGIPFVSLQDALVRHLRPAMLLTLAGAILVLLIACANVGNLLLVRAGARSGELALRRALGADSARIALHLFAESFVLSLLALLGGLAFAHGSLPWVLGLLPPELSAVGPVSLGGGPSLTAAGLVLVTTLACGLAPTLRFGRYARPTGSAPNRSAVGGSRRAHAVQRALVVVEVSMAVVLVYGASLLVASFIRLTGEDIGFSADNLFTARLAPASASYSDVAVRRSYFERVLADVRALPGVSSAGAIHFLPIAEGGPSVFFQTDPADAGGRSSVGYRVVTPGYLGTMGIPLRRGRPLLDQDRAGALPVGLVNDALAAATWPTEDPIGEVLYRTSGTPWFTVVGVVGNVRQLARGLPPQPEVYLPLAQSEWASTMTVVVRTLTLSPDLRDAVARVVRGVDPDVPVTRLASMASLLNASVAEPRFYSILFSMFGGLALLLSGIGVYGVLSYIATLRRSEIGLRLALGASQTRVLAEEIKGGTRVALAGLLLGLLAIAATARVIRSMLYEVAPLDGRVLVTTTGLIAIAVFLGIWIPARRASMLDPVQTLRAE